MGESFVWKETCVCSATPKQCKWNKCYSGIDVSLRQSCLHELCGGNGNYTEAGKRWEELVGSIFWGGRILDAICESICKLFGQFHRFPIGKRRIWLFFLLVHFVRSIKGRIDRRNSAKGPWNEKMDSLAKFFRASKQTNELVVDSNLSSPRRSGSPPLRPHLNTSKMSSQSNHLIDWTAPGKKKFFEG